MEYSVESNERAQIGLSKAIVILGGIFAIALAVVVGNRLSNDSMAVLVGAACGISASIPACLALVIALKQNWGRTQIERNDEPRARYPYQPPIVMIAPPQQPYAQNPAPYFIPPHLNDEIQPARQFKIIGEE
ncbi:MAG: hypothetical protein HY257_00710 [Chloroflexi bacterium]|nr:hypothetical protein [Chloroflexota bacterium]